MTTPRKPAAKRPAAKRTGKPAAVAPVEEPEAIDSEEYVPLPVSDEERQAKLEAYAALKRASVAVPEELAVEVEGWIREEERRRALAQAQRAEQQATVEEANASGPWYVLNGYSG